MRPTARATWLAIALAVVAYNTTAKEGDLLSEQVDKWIEAQPLLTRGLILILAAHLANLVSPRYDLVSILFVTVRKLAWRRIVETTNV